MAALIEPGKYKLLSLLVVPLYVKRKQDKVLENFVRGQIFGFIQANPGTHYNYIKRALRINNGALAYHLNVLESDELILSKNDGIYRRFYPKNAAIPEAESNDGINYTHVQLNGTQDKIINLIQSNPGMTQKAIAKRLGKSNQVINYNINAMAEIGLVQVERDGNKTKCFVHRLVRIDDTKEL